MSCMLYNRESYLALAGCGAFRDLVFNPEGLHLASHYENPETFAVELFNLNRRAFICEYEDRHNDAIEQAETSVGLIDYFREFIEADATGNKPLIMAKLFTLFFWIDYQCGDATNYDKIDTAWHIRWVKDWAAQQMAEYIESVLI